MPETKNSPKISPNYVLNRVVTQVDSFPVINKFAGVNMDSYRYANVQVIPSGGANPNVEILWWSGAAGRYIQENTPITENGVGVNTPFEFTVECFGRNMLVAVTTLAAGEVEIYVSGFDRINE